jgi:hypothetical protein
MQNDIPQPVKVLLWDVNPETISLSDSSQFIIERILEYGDLAEIKWMESTFSRKQIIETLMTSKRISSKSGNFFALKYNLEKETLLCLQQPFTNKQDRF